MGSDRVSKAVRFAYLLSCACVGRNSLGTLLEEERQVRRICGDHPAGVRLLLGHAHWGFAGSPWKDLARDGGVASGYCLLCLRGIAAVARRAQAAGTRYAEGTLESVCPEIIIRPRPDAPKPGGRCVSKSGNSPTRVQRAL